MRYTHHGIGHPAVLREIIRDCANTGFADGPEAEENENDLDFNLRPYGEDLEKDSDNRDCEQESDDDDVDDEDEDDGEDESSVDGLDDQAEYDENEEDDYIYF